MFCSSLLNPILSMIKDGALFLIPHLHWIFGFIPKETFYCLYDKKTRRLKSTRYHSDGFVDDISGLDYCCPEFATNTELIEVISPEKWLEWEDKGSEMPIRKEISLDDNPIIRIVHFLK